MLNYATDWICGCCCNEGDGKGGVDCCCWVGWLWGVFGCKKSGCGGGRWKTNASYTCISSDSLYSSRQTNPCKLGDCFLAQLIQWTTWRFSCSLMNKILKTSSWEDITKEKELIPKSNRCANVFYSLCIHLSFYSYLTLSAIMRRFVLISSVEFYIDSFWLYKLLNVHRMLQSLHKTISMNGKEFF